MQIESKIIGIINDKLKNPMYETLRLLNPDYAIGKFQSKQTYYKI